jgi:hypothetical protein
VNPVLDHLVLRDWLEEQGRFTLGAQFDITDAVAVAEMFGGG